MHLASPAGRLRDRDIREAIIEDLIPGIAGAEPYRLIDELGIYNGSVRADLALINGKLHGFEIKSDVDSLKRLAGQEEIYSLVFDTMRLVLAPRHVDSAIELVPDWWEIVVAELDGHCLTLRTVRPGKLNKTLDATSLLTLLWHAELVELAQKLAPAPGIKRMRCGELHEHISKLVSVERIAKFVRETLKQRSAWRPDAPPA